MTQDVFESPKLLVTEAREYIDELEAAITIFSNRRPFARAVDVDRDTRQFVCKIRLTAQLPGKLRVLVKRITADLRDSLDHAVYSAAIALGVVNPEKTGFPFANDETHLIGELGSWKFAHVPPEIHSILLGFAAYPTGNDLLVGLNRIRNSNTHRALVPIGAVSCVQSMAFSGVLTEGQIGYSKWLPATNEVEYMRLGRGSKVNADLNIAFEVTFGDIDIVRNKPVISTLREIAIEVDRAVLAVEAETCRILATRF